MAAEMFREALLESGPQQPTNRKWTTLTSLLLQCGLVALAIALPMAYTDVLSVRFNPHALAAPSEAPPQHQAAPQAGNVSSVLHSPRVATVVQSGRRYNFHTIGEDIPAAPACCLSSGNGTSMDLSQLMPHAAGPRLDIRHEVQRPVLVTSTLMEGHLIHRVQPVYPQIAKITHTQGTVILQAVIGKDGRISALHVVSGTPLLSGAAVEAVRQWEYRPYLLNGQPIEVETQITVNFTIGG